jgi:hypothetical protein
MATGRHVAVARWAFSVAVDWLSSGKPYALLWAWTTARCGIGFWKYILQQQLLIRSYSSQNIATDDLEVLIDNEMDDFSIQGTGPQYVGTQREEIKPVVPTKGCWGSWHQPLAEKRQRSFMTIGSPGGSTLLLCCKRYWMYIQAQLYAEAVNAPHFHHQWLFVIAFEPNTFNTYYFIKKQEATSDRWKNSSVVGEWMLSSRCLQTKPKKVNTTLRGWYRCQF